MTKNKNTKDNNNNASLRAQDPFLAREQEKYSDPLPSREWVINTLEQNGVPTSIPDLAKQLSIRAHELDFFDRRINAMVRDGQVYINRRNFVCVAEKLAMEKCRIEAHKDGFGFAIPLEPTTQGDFAMYERQMRSLMHGDIVTIRPTGTDRRGRRLGQVLDIIERANTNIVGRVHLQANMILVAPADPRLTQSIVIPKAPEGVTLSDSQIVVVEIEHFPHAQQPASGKIIEVLGDYADSGMEIEIAVRKHHLPHQFSDACLEQAQNIPEDVQASELENRVDLRHLPLVTIDGETARDFDDAVFAEKVGRNYRLVVAIADVSHYVKPDDAIDTDAQERGTSVYFPRRVIPMLPEKLSNGICSLNPDVNRLCMVCDMVITYAGNIKSFEFYPAVMKSQARLTYTEVWDWIENGTDNPLKPHIDVLYTVFQKLLKKRKERGAIEFDTQETQMVFNDNGKIDRIEPIFRNEAHRLIEECMLAANVCAANYLLESEHPALFRSHLGPTLEKLTTLREQLSMLGLQLEGGDKPTPLDYAKLAEQFENRMDKDALQIMLLRSMKQAVYEPNNQGHFGLAYDAYTHFTSPIRRYPDLTVHRAIKAVLLKKQYTPKSWQALGIHTSYTERRADDASRDVESWLKTYYMKDKVGEVFEGTIAGLTSFGVFVNLTDLHIEGLIHISELGQDYFNFRPETMSIEGERSGIVFKLGDKMVVKVVRADLETSKIDLSLVSGGQLGKKHPKSTEGKDKADKHGKPKKRSSARSPRRSSEPSKKAATQIMSHLAENARNKKKTASAAPNPSKNKSKSSTRRRRK